MLKKPEKINPYRFRNTGQKLSSLDFTRQEKKTPWEKVHLFYRLHQEAKGLFQEWSKVCLVGKSNLGVACRF